MDIIPGKKLLLVAVLTGCAVDEALVQEDVQDAVERAGDGGEVRTGTFVTPAGRQQLTYQLIDGRRIFEGDILLPPSEEELAKEGVSDSTGKSSGSARWPDNTVIYRLAADLPTATIANVNAAIAHWEQNTSIRFQIENGEDDWVMISNDATGCFSDVGRQGTGMQTVNLADGACGLGATIHELGHAVGLWHEQSRADRDAYTVVDLDCVDVNPIDRTHNFTQYTSGADYGLYDFSSIMQYPSSSFFMNETPPASCETSAQQITLWRRSSPSGTYDQIAGQRTGLSFIDRQGVEEMYSNLYGHAVAVGDFNDDGFADLAVGAPRRVGGEVHVYLGSTSGLTLDRVLDRGGDIYLTDRFGYALASADFDADGIDDLAIGIPGAEGGEGRVVVYRGHRQNSGVLGKWKELDQSGLGSNEPGDKLGYALTAGDLDGDGDGDLAVGAPGENWGTSTPSSGAVFLYRGASSNGLDPWQLLGQSGIGSDEAGDSFGHALASTDFDGDGDRDLAIGAPHERYGSDPEAGVVFLFRGGSSVTGWRILRPIVGTSADYTAWDLFFGFSLTTGDFDADGHRDLAVGAPGATVGTATWAGRVLVFAGTASGPTAGKFSVTESAPTMGASFGFSLSAGKYNGDGYSDLAVGAPGSMPSSGNAAGRVFVYPGRSSVTSLGTASVLAQTGLTSEPGDRFGGEVGFLDFDHDGDHDLAVGLPGELNGDLAEGRVDLYRSSGASLSVLTSLRP